MGSSGGGGTPKDPKMPDVPAGKKVAYGSSSPVIPPDAAYTSYLTPGQVASGGMPVNRAPGGISGAPSQLAASTAMGGGGAGQASQAPPGAPGQMSEIERINKLIAMGIAPRDLLSILMAAKDPEPDFDIWASQWGSGGRGGGGGRRRGSDSDAMSAPTGSFGPGGNTRDAWGGLR